MSSKKKIIGIQNIDKSLYITNEGTYILKKYFNENEINIIKNELNILPKVTSDFQIEKNEPFDIFLETTEKIFIPKFYALKKFTDIRKLF